MTINRILRVLALIAVFALFAAACGNDDDGEAASGDPVEAPAPVEEGTSEPAPEDEPEAEAPAPEDKPEAEAPAPEDKPEAEAPAPEDKPEAEAPVSLLGAPNPASGEAIELYYVWSGVSPSIDNTTDRLAAEAMQDYINEYGGGLGVDGRPLELAFCATDSDAALAAACGSEVVNSNVPFVLMNVNGEVASWAAPVLSADVGIFAYAASDTPLFARSELVAVVSNAVSSLGGAAATVTHAVGASSTSFLIIDVPAATGPFQAMVPPTFESLGAGPVNIVPISPAATDHSADIQVEMQTTNPDHFYIVGNPAFCTLSIRALRDAGFEGTITAISNCLDEALLEALGSDLEGVVVTYQAGEDPADPDVAQFAAILDEFASDEVPVSGTPVGAYVAIESFRRFMADYDGDWTDSAAIAAHIKGHSPVPHPTMAGAELVCDGSAGSAGIIPFSCADAFAWAVLDETGTPGPFTVVPRVG